MHRKKWTDLKNSSNLVLSIFILFGAIHGCAQGLILVLNSGLNPDGTLDGTGDWTKVSHV